MGLQFKELFRDDLFFQLAERANRLAARIQGALEELGCQFLVHSPTNLIFPILPNSIIAQLQKDYDFLIWQKVDGEHTAVRLATSWACPEEVVDRFILRVRELFQNR